MIAHQDIKCFKIRIRVNRVSSKATRLFLTKLQKQHQSIDSSAGVTVGEFIKIQYDQKNFCPFYWIVSLNFNDFVACFKKNGIILIFWEITLCSVEWRRCIRCPLFIGHFLQKSPTISGSFADDDENNRQFKAPMGLRHPEWGGYE